MVTAMILCAFIIPDNANILVVSKNCPPCYTAQRRLKNEDVIVVDSSEFSVKSTPTFIVIRNGKEVSRTAGLKTLRQYKALMNVDYVLSQSDFSGVIYFEGELDIISSMILKKIKRFNVTIIEGTPELALDYNITGYPTFVIIKNGKEIGRYISA